MQITVQQHLQGLHVLVNLQVKLIVSGSVSFLFPYITFPVFDLCHLFIREANTDLIWRFESNTGITFICFSTGRAIVMAIKGKTVMLALHSKCFQITWPTRKGGRIENSSTRVQPEATANYKCLFFLNFGWMPAAIRDQHSVPHRKLL